MNDPLSDLLSTEERMRPFTRWDTVKFLAMCAAGALAIGVLAGLIGLALVVLTEGLL